MQKGMTNKTIRLVKNEELQATVVAQVAMAVTLGGDELVHFSTNIAITQRSRMPPMKSMITGAELSQHFYHTTQSHAPNEIYDDRGLTKQPSSSEVVYSLYNPLQRTFLV